MEYTFTLVTKLSAPSDTLSRAAQILGKPLRAGPRWATWGYRTEAEAHKAFNAINGSPIESLMEGSFTGHPSTYLHEAIVMFTSNAAMIAFVKRLRPYVSKERMSAVVSVFTVSSLEEARRLDSAIALVQDKIVIHLWDPRTLKLLSRQALSNPLTRSNVIKYDELLDVADEAKNWYAGQGDPIYALVSSVYAGRDVPLQVAEDALRNLEIEYGRAKHSEDREALGDAIFELDFKIHEVRMRARSLPNPLKRKRNPVERLPKEYDNVRLVTNAPKYPDQAGYLKALALTAGGAALIYAIYNTVMKGSAPPAQVVNSQPVPTPYGT
jgi:hypothetical protein